MEPVCQIHKVDIVFKDGHRACLVCFLLAAFPADAKKPASGASVKTTTPAQEEAEPG